MCCVWRRSNTSKYWLPLVFAPQRMGNEFQRRNTHRLTHWVRWRVIESPFSRESTTNDQKIGGAYGGIVIAKTVVIHLHSMGKVQNMGAWVPHTLSSKITKAAIQDSYGKCYFILRTPQIWRNHIFISFGLFRTLCAMYRSIITWNWGLGWTNSMNSRRFLSLMHRKTCWPMGGSRN